MKIEIIAMETTESCTELHMRAGTLYNEQKFSEALEYFISTMKQAEKEDNKEIYVSAIGYIANIYSYFGDKPNSIFYLTQGYETAQTTSNIKLQCSFINNLISVYCKIEDINNAKKYFNILKQLKSKEHSNYLKYSILIAQGRLCNAEGKYAEAVKIHKEALDFAMKHNLDNLKIMFQKYEIAKNYEKLKDYKNSLKWGQLCMKSAIDEHHTQLLINVYYVLYLTYKGLNDTANEDRYFNLFKSCEDSLYNTTDFFKNSYQLKEYETKNKEDFINLRYGSIFVVVLIIIIFVIILQRKKKNKEVDESKKDTENVNLNEKLVEDLFVKIDEIINKKEIIFNPDFNLNDLANLIHSNTTYVSWVINNKYGLNFKSLINKKRIEEACVMLSDNDICKNYTIQSIYEEIGYKNATSFIRAFKKQVGMTPVEYRNKKKEEQQ